MSSKLNLQSDSAKPSSEITAVAESNLGHSINITFSDSVRQPRVET